MRKIYRLDSDYLTEEVNEIISKIPKVTKETITKFVDYLDLIEEICIKEDGTYGKDEGKEIMIVVLYEWEKEKMIELTNLVYDSTRYTVKDISEEVLFGVHTEKDYPGVEEKVKKIFDAYLDMYLDTDVVLDKINKYGINSLTKRDKKALESHNI
jgi:hypothetical protein